MALGSGEESGTPGRQRDYLKVFMAVCCLSAVGIAGSTYDSTLESDPDEIIDVKHEWLPIGKDKIQNFKNPESSASAGGGGGGGSSEEPAPCTGGLIGVLASLFPTLIPPCGPFYLLGLVLPVLLLLAALGLTYRYRRRIAAPAMALAGWLRERPWASGEDATDAWPPSRPANDVHGAWVSMVERADVDRPRTRTPGECARAAVDAGLEDEAVATITQLFVEVKYAGQALTDDRQQRARQWADRLTDGTALSRPANGGFGADDSGRESRRGRLHSVGRLLGFGLWAGRRGEE